MLRWLRAALTLIVLCLSVFLGAVFATQNTVSVPLTLGAWALAERPVAVWLLSFLILRGFDWQLNEFGAGDSTASRRRVAQARKRKTSQAVKQGR
jgi:uncharacterized integral membrane protein